MKYTESQTFERRRHPRIALETEVGLRSINKNSLIFGWIQDISGGGFKVRVDIPSAILKLFSLYVGDKVLFETYRKYPNLKGRGDIRWISNEENKAGIKFDELDDKSKRHLEVLLTAAS